MRFEGQPMQRKHSGTRRPYPEKFGTGLSAQRCGDHRREQFAGKIMQNLSRSRRDTA
jgi:hypothetical protein